jgi:hypothetical protein
VSDLNTFGFIKDVVKNGPQRNKKTPLEASYWHFLESPLHVLFLSGKSLENRNGLKDIIKGGLGRLTT